MAHLGWFDGELRPDGWFDAELHPAGWFDTEAINTTSGSTAYSLTANPGSYALSGNSATLTKTAGATAYTLTANPGSYSLTGGAASVRVGRRITANPSTYSLTGGTASVRVGRRITANLGTYTLTGGTGVLKVGRRVTALSGSYSLTGGSATLTKTGASIAYTLTALPGSYAIQGSEATLTLSGQPSYTAEAELRPRKWYVRRKKQIHIFDTADEADSFIRASDEADKAIEKAKSKSAKKRVLRKVYEVAKPSEIIDVDHVAHLVSLYGLQFDIPSLIAQQDFETFMHIAAMAQEIEEEELLLLA